jgi:hypothetical protein
LARPPPPPPPPPIEKERQLADGRGRGWKAGGHGAESYDRKKAWSSTNHSILSVYNTLCTRARTLLEQSLGARNRVGTELSYRPSTHVAWRAGTTTLLLFGS